MVMSSFIATQWTRSHKIKCHNEQFWVHFNAVQQVFLCASCWVKKSTVKREFLLLPSHLVSSFHFSTNWLQTKNILVCLKTLSLIQEHFRPLILNLAYFLLWSLFVRVFQVIFTRLSSQICCKSLVSTWRIPPVYEEGCIHEISSLA